MATTPEGVYYPVPTDAYDPPGDIQKEAESLGGRIIVPVANTTERNALAATVNPSPSKPLYVHRQNIAAGSKTEYTEDGSRWVGVGEQPAWDLTLNTTLNAPSGDWVAPSSNWDRVAYNGAAPAAEDGRITIPERGLYSITISAWFQANQTGRRLAGLGINGNAPSVRFQMEGRPPSGNSVYVNGTLNRLLVAGDVIRLMTFQDSGVHVGLQAQGTSLTVVRITELGPPS